MKMLSFLGPITYFYKQIRSKFADSLKLDCYLTLGWKGMPRTNTPAYWIIAKIMRCCDYGPRIFVFNSVFFILKMIHVYVFPHIFYQCQATARVQTLDLSISD